MSDLTCPYCDHDFEVNHDDGFGYSEDARHEQECPSCEKTFVFKTSIHYFYSESKADCLNDAEHDLKLSHRFPVHFSVMRCKNCDYQRSATAEEIEQKRTMK